MNRDLQLRSLMAISNLSSKLTMIYENGYHSKSSYTKPKEDMPLTNDEWQKLDSLNGKAKRDYVRELKAKYEN